jgi:hypothetical protein
MTATKGQGGGFRNNYQPKQNRMLDNNVCHDRLFSLNKKNTLDSSCNDKEDNNGEGENKGDMMLT